MDLKSGYPFWAIRNGLMCSFSALVHDLRCDVAILGGGITAALIADELSAHGHSVCVLEQRDICWGSTAASTALLQYEIDTHMVDLAARYGEADAVLAYRSCVEAIDLLADKAREVRDVDFARLDSLYYASRRGHRKALEQEFDLRARHGFDVQWLEPDEIEQSFGFRAPGAILSGQAARVDPYRLTSRLLAKVRARGAAVHDRTRVEHIVPTTRGVTLHTTDGARVRCRNLVIAAGYAGQSYIDQRLAKNRSSYAFVTDPLSREALGPLAKTMVWESARPYLYLRVTGDGRLVVGGEDDALDIPAKRDARVQRKAEVLAKKVQRLFPHLQMRPTFAWAGTFAETADGLPWFGRHPDTGPRILHAMAYGGNGITYSMLGAGLLRAAIERRAHPLAKLFGFDRCAS